MGAVAGRGRPRWIHRDDLPELANNDSVDVRVEGDEEDGGRDNGAEVEEHQVIVAHHFDEETHGGSVLRCMPAEEWQETDHDSREPTGGDYNWKGKRKSFCELMDRSYLDFHPEKSKCPT